MQLSATWIRFIVLFFTFLPDECVGQMFDQNTLGELYENENENFSGCADYRFITANKK